MSREGEVEVAVWMLEGVLPDGKTWVIPVDPLPFRIGRQRDCQLLLNSPSVSRAHAELFLSPEGLAVRDLGSTNGTFLNGARLQGEVRLHSGDILHFGEVEFRVEMGGDSDSTTDTHMALESHPDLPALLPRNEVELVELMEGRRFQTLFQPIINLATGATAAFEAVTRGTHPALPVAPADLFRIAERLGRDAELSRILRAEALRAGACLAGPPRLYLNIHPSETIQPSLYRSIEAMWRQFPQVPTTMEVSEKALVEPGRMRQLKAELKDLGICLAYDDFGAGQARILELIQAPPDVLKFDMALVRGLHEAPPATRKMLRSLVAMATDLGVETLAEGIECEGERQACLETGFTFGQGFHIGVPMPAPPVGGDPAATPPL